MFLITLSTTSFDTECLMWKITRSFLPQGPRYIALCIGMLEMEEMQVCLDQALKYLIVIILIVKQQNSIFKSS